MDSESVVDWGLMLDCDKQGCDPKHGDHGRVFDIGPEMPKEAYPIHNHATTVVSRRVMYLPWVPAQFDGPEPCDHAACGEDRCAHIDGGESDA